MINNITFTGVDQWCNLLELDTIARQASPLRIEWAMLAGSSTGKSPRFPDVDTIVRFRDRAAYRGTPAALHLCGRLARAVAAGELDEVVDLGTGFGRIQVNAASHDYDLLAELARRTGATVIAQQQDGFTKDGPPADGLEYLDDGSGGRGISQVDGWSTAWKDVRCGYAGGIGPGNVGKAMRRAAAAGGADAWIDMESHIRTAERLDTRKVSDVIQEATVELTCSG